jgi:hypothetical protein
MAASRFTSQSCPHHGAARAASVLVNLVALALFGASIVVLCAVCS